jgi:hypothetical protein
MFMMKSKTIDGDKVPSWAVIYRLKTVMRTKGSQNWYVLDPKEGGEDGEILWATDEQYDAGSALHDAFAKGEKRADMADVDGAEPTPAASGPGKAARDKATKNI